MKLSIIIQLYNSQLYQHGKYDGLELSQSIFDLYSYFFLILLIF